MGELPLSPGRHTREDSRVKRGCGLGPGGGGSRNKRSSEEEGGEVENIYLKYLPMEIAKYR